MTRYQLSIGATGLPKGGGWRRLPNPYAVVKVTGGPRQGTTVGTTEVVRSAKNADFTKMLFIETDPSVYFPIRVAIYNDQNHTELASANFEATEIHASRGHVQVQKCANGVEIICSMEESIKGNVFGTAVLQFRGLDMKNVEPGLMGLGRSDPFFELARKNADHTSGIARWNTVYRSKHIVDHLNPFWDHFSFSLEELCYCDPSWPLRLSVWDHEENGKHHLIGEIETTLELLTERVAIKGNADRDRALEIVSDSKSAPGVKKTRGLIVVLQASFNRDENNRDPPGRVNVYNGR